MPHSSPASTSVPPLARTSGARFFLEGLDAPVRAHVASRDDGGVTLRQELPFLQLTRKMRDEDGRVATLASVGVALRDGTPSLVLDFRYEGRGDEPTLSFASAPSQDPSQREAACGRAERRDSTVPYAIERRESTLPYAPTILDDATYRGHVPPASAAPATPPSLPVPSATRAWHRILWDGLRAAFAAL